ncbi:hypothetical protein BKI52_45190 [marine bacterium AO1-C]|nr:hypothetical protein BKI52_45190 [marine bacterium AO1-C]
MISTKNFFPIDPKKDLNSQRLAHAISLVFHPLLLPTLFLGVLFFTTPLEVIALSSSLKWPFLGIVFIMTFVFPVCITAIVLLSRKAQQPIKTKPGEVSGHLIEEFYEAFPEERKENTGIDLQMQTIQERKIVFALVSVVYIIATFLFDARTYEIVPILTIALEGITISLLVLTVITFFWKISAHSVAIGGVLGIFFALSSKVGNGALMYHIVGTVILCGIVMTSRLYLDAHKPAQIVVGFIVGFIINFLTILLFL